VIVKRQQDELDDAKNKGSTWDRKEIYEKSHAVIIGISKYDKWPLLESAVADAELMRAGLLKEGFDSVTTIYDEEATQRRLLTVLGHELPRKIGKKDRLVIYFSGHGQTEEQPNGDTKGYMIPVDAKKQKYAATAISMEQIRSLSAGIPAKHILYLIDSCYSGMGFSGSDGVSPDSTGYMTKIASIRAVQLITAGGKEEQAQNRCVHGVFTKNVLKGLDGKADFSRDGIITASELSIYLRLEMSASLDNAQNPVWGRLEGEGELVFFR
jgi:uncharacterized caspase-like protein